MRLLVLFLTWLALAGPLRAQAPAPPGPDFAAILAQAKADLAQVGADAQNKNLTDADIQARLAKIPPIEARLADALANLTPRQQNLKARLAQIGPAPAAGGAPEDPQTTQLRRDLTHRLAVVGGAVTEDRLLMVTAQQITAGLSDRLRENFAARLWARTRSILDPALWRDFAVALPGDLTRLAQAAGEEADEAAPLLKDPRDLVLVVLAALGGVILVGPARVMLNRLGYRRAARADGIVPRLHRNLLALWLVTVATGAPLLAGLLVRAGLLEAGALSPDLDKAAVLLIRAATFAAFLTGLGRALLSPSRPEWRLAPAPEDMVARLAPFPGLIGATAALAAFVAGMNSILGASLASRVASDCATLLIELAAVGGALAAVGRARLAHLDATPSAAETESRAPWLFATLAAWIALGATLVAVLFGYLALASFLMRETVWIGAVLAVLALLLRIADDLFPALLSPGSPLGGALETAVGLSRSAIEQLAVLLSGLARLLLLFLAWAAVLAPFGASADDIFQRFTATDFVVRLGLVAISPGAILGGLALFAVGLFITRAVRRWFEVRYLPKTDLDVGLRTSLAAGVTYLGALIAVLVAFAYLGLSVAQIALFASALSVGVGFGLQAIIGNFVSGLILLAERPVRVGDWIALGDLEGDVRKISIRATEIEMMDRSRLIVPNSELVSKIVRNVTQSGALGRVRIVLRVDAAADPAQTADIVLGRLKAHAEVLEDPAPAVFMTDTQGGALEFNAYAYVASPRHAYRVRSELLFQIVPDLKAAKIALAGPQTQVRVSLEAAGVGSAAVPAPDAPPAGLATPEAAH